MPETGLMHAQPDRNHLGPAPQLTRPVRPDQCGWRWWPPGETDLYLCCGTHLRWLTHLASRPAEHHEAPCVVHQSARWSTGHRVVASLPFPTQELGLASLAIPLNIIARPMP